MKKLTFLIMFCFITSLSYATEIIGQNINVDSKYLKSGVTFKKCNFYSKIPKTELSETNNCNFEMCNFYDCTLPDNNVTKKCNFFDSTQEPEKSKEEMYINDLEKIITTNSLKLPVKDI